MIDWYSSIEWGSILAFKIFSGISIPSILNIGDLTACEFVYNHRDFFDPIPLTVGLIHQTNFVENDLSKDGKYSWWLSTIPRVSYIYLSMNSRGDFTLSYYRRDFGSEVVGVQFFNELQFFINSAVDHSIVTNTKERDFWFDSNKLFPKLFEADKLFSKFI